MDVKLSPDQSELLRAVHGQLQRVLDHEDSASLAVSALAEGGFLEVLTSGGTAVEAALVIEEAARTAPGVPVSGRTLVGPLLTDRPLPTVVGLVSRPNGALTRHAQQAEAFLVLDGDVALLLEASQATVEPATSRWGYPVGRVTARGGESLGSGSGARLMRYWEIALSAEIGALMEAAVLHAARYVTDRHQFGKPIGAFPTVQHRLAHAYVRSQGAIWLARRAAWDPEDTLAAAAAACYAAEGIRDVMATAHQVCGAIGLTDEFGLWAYTSRMEMLQTELGGPIAHARRLGSARWAGRIAEAKDHRTSVANQSSPVAQDVRP